MEKYEGLSFDEAMKLLEEKISYLEKDDQDDQVELAKVYDEAVLLKNYCAKLLSDERAEIKRIAKENNIPLSEIGLEDEDPMAEYMDAELLEDNENK